MTLSPSNQLSDGQKAWAKAHDWYVGIQPVTGCIVVADRYTKRHADGSVTSHEDVLAWTGSYAALRDWAGY